MVSSSVQNSSKMKEKTSRSVASKGDKAVTKKKPDAETILNAASKTNFKNKDEAAKFEAEFKDRFIGRSSAKNILCVLANKDNLPRKIEWSDIKTKEFLDWILKSYHHLLEEKDKKNNSLTPLHLALTKDHTAFIKAILEFPNLININKVLTVEGRDGNVLHIALEKSPSSFEPLVQRLIEFPNVFKAMHPATKNTPLHDCMLIDLDDLDAEDEDDEENSDEENTSENGEYEHDSDDEHTLSTTSEEGQLRQPAVGNQQPYVNEIGHPEELSLQRRQSTKVPGPSEYPNKRLPFVELLIESDKSALYCYNEKKRTPYQERIHQLEEYYKKAGGSTKKKDFEVWANKDPINKCIRLYCVTNLPRNEATKCLYNTGNEKQIEFDLGGLGRDTISQEYLDQLSKHLKFESILKYVALPKLIMEGPARRMKPKASLTKGIQGRSDLTKVFQWLKRNHVEKIVKVIVLDDQDPCHADASIEEALKGFDIEIWDWKRLDLSTEVIRKSTSVVREISLYSSGNNSVLMGWASTDGLPNEQYFPELKQVSLYIREGYEHEERLLGYIDDFKLKIQNRSDHRIAINVIKDDQLGSYASQFQSRVGGSQSESPWIHCMLRLSELLEKPCKTANIKPVKVAIIDDGVDVSLSSLQDKIALGQSFCPYPNSTDMMSPYFMSSSNHGTSMATLICSLCPMVRLYVARLDQRQTLGGSQRHITADSAAQAIQWATDCGVDIISMSWTIETTISGSPEMESLRKAIQRASTNKIVMFCSTSDQGSMTSDHRCYPGDFGGCIKIGSASNTGDAMAYVKVGTVDFLLPGSNVPFSITEGKTNLHESGSSIATAAASGLAAFLISSSRLLQENVDFFKDYSNMKTAFQNLSQSNKFPAVNERLERLFIQTLERIRKEDQKEDSQGEIQEQKKSRDLPMVWCSQCQRALSSVMFGITNIN